MPLPNGAGEATAGRTFAAPAGPLYRTSSPEQAQFRLGELKTGAGTETKPGCRYSRAHHLDSDQDSTIPGDGQNHVCMDNTISTNFLRSRALRLLVAIWALTAISHSRAQPLASVFLKGPYLQAPGPDTMTIMWESPTNGPGLLRFGLRGKLDQEARLEVPWKFNAVSKISVTNIIPIGTSEITAHSRTNRAADGGTNVISYYTTNITAVAKTNISSGSLTNRLYMYEITLNALRPDSVYSYVAEMAGASTPPKKFKTFG